MNQLIDILRKEMEQYQKQADSCGAAANEDSSAPLDWSAADHDQGMADGLERAIKLIDLHWKQAEKEFMIVRWNNIAEHMGIEYCSLKRMLEKIPLHEVQNVRLWLQQEPLPGAHIELRWMVIVRVQ